MAPSDSPINERDNALRTLFWDTMAARKDDPSSVRVQGRLYTVGDEDAPEIPRGSYGAERYILRDGGHVIQTTNLWEIGPIPEDYKDQLADNAEFLTRDDYLAARHEAEFEQFLKDAARRHSHPQGPEIER